MSRSDLEERIYGWHQEVESNVIEFIISSLRKKLGCKTYIINVRGVGWMVSKNG
ncbi:helix-turn-helix domain-containing protein [Vibrio fluvialis]|uniref:helix-turn-helix domain-containing protein n=1 Tax=Vibrio fluvialis TaxID=676 RepID=UPI002D7EFAEB|nr:helix-turn-helix domain-containing protein [Vibrio fluvialis]